MSTKSDVDVVWDVLFASEFFLEYEVLCKVVFLNPKYNSRVEQLAKQLCQLFGIEVRSTFGLTLKHISRRVATPWTILYRSADWTLKKAMKAQNNKVIQEVLKNGKRCVSPAVLGHYSQYVVVKEWLQDPQVPMYATLKVPEGQMIWRTKEFARHKVVVRKSDIDFLGLAMGNICILAYMKEVLKSGDSAYISCVSKEYDMTVYIKSLKINPVDPIYSAVYTMDLNCIETAFKTKRLSLASSLQYRSNDTEIYLNSKVSLPLGESTPAKLEEVLKLAKTYQIHSAILRKMLTCIVCLNDDVDSLPVLLSLYPFSHSTALLETVCKCNARSIYIELTKQFDQDPNSMEILWPVPRPNLSPELASIYTPPF